MSIKACHRSLGTDDQNANKSGRQPIFEFTFVAELLFQLRAEL
ncbi:hypothetical protein PJK55_00550 [Exiguobacterium sp. MMG028]|nr:MULTISPECIES: hypothetical protein [Exiguobacterium]MDA5559205.1 hypothetical protein [Exiguobacterium sp. MMG028]